VIPFEKDEDKDEQQCGERVRVTTSANVDHKQVEVPDKVRERKFGQMADQQSGCDIKESEKKLPKLAAEKRVGDK
jgi:hypothetical protein